ncbi:hypothetical protein F4859DRAFT_504884 [Xylaria cf. heliscus]|nr:hypothetical protein F4859DRAFT_504884 [Xylaria cf. heliscus]
MCGRYALALRPSQILRMLRDDNMPVYEAPDDPEDGVEEEDDGSSNTGGGEEYSGPRQSYNFAPSYRGVVYRADVPDWGAGPRSGRNGGTEAETNDAPLPSHDTSMEGKGQKKETDEQHASKRSDVHYKLQTMKWGLIPFWTKRNPGHGPVMKTINCRDDALAQAGGMWSSMKARKRCIVIAQGFYEWLKKDGGREKLPHYVKRKDGKLMCFAGLWDVVQYENDEVKQYTYTIITTDSNKQLNFLHDRMPVILDNGSEKMRNWLDPGRYEWSKELQSLLIPYDGELEVYPVSKDVGKVGNNSPTFIIPIDSKENKSNIANFFAKGATTPRKKEVVKREEGSGVRENTVKVEGQPKIEVTSTEGFVMEDMKREEEPKVKRENGDEDEDFLAGVKREAGEELTDQERPSKLPNTAQKKAQDAKSGRGQSRGGKQKISATSNKTRSPVKAAKSAGTQKITKFFANSS